jgi:hypothetical protein
VASGADTLVDARTHTPTHTYTHMHAYVHVPPVYICSTQDWRKSSSMVEANGENLYTHWCSSGVEVGVAIKHFLCSLCTSQTVKYMIPFAGLTRPRAANGANKTTVELSSCTHSGDFGLVYWPNDFFGTFHVRQTVDYGVRKR